MSRIALLSSLILLLAGCAAAPSRPPPAVAPAVPEAAAALPPPAVPAPAPEPAPEPRPEPLPAPPEPAVAPPVRMQALEAFAELNDERLLYVYPGMSMQAVERVMGDRRSGSYVNPHKRQTLTSVDGKVYEVLFYLTRAPRSGRAVTESELTPVIFVNGRVVAIGRYALKKLRRSACAGGRCP